ncbi:MAG TPA: ATP-binding cassette domain-containing protein [Xanthomonadaceae bacterium]|jgi:ATP-binding cassette subfamily F protein 3
MISFRNFALRRGERLLLSDVDLALHGGWRVGVVGRNGTGKSSLFAAIQREIEADRGDLDLSGKARIASVAQETPSLPDAAIDFVLGGDVEVAAALRAEAVAMEAEDWDAVAQAHHRLDELNGYDATARAGRLLHGLGFPADTHQRAVSAFSGGWRVRLNLARALMMPSDLLLLDEPTNHLDLDAVLWLEQWLLRYQGTLLLISHDREFLDGVCTHTLHLHEGKAKLYTGDYTSFEHQRAEQLHQQQIAFEKEQVEREHLQKFIDRFKAKASKAKQAQSRMKRLAKLAGTEAVRAERELRINFAEPVKLPNSLIRLNHVDAGYTSANGAVAKILDEVGFGLEAGDRIGLLGPNGAGKSTLVKTLVGELRVLAGERSAHPDMQLGYFAQHTVESLQPGQSPINHLQDIAPTVSTQEFRDFLGRWNFPGNRAFESVDTFSGGERARLALALIAWRKPNVLLLDEPTNHLDLDMREALAEALSVFDGAIVLVSHDRHLIGLVCDTFWRVADGHVEAFDGDLDAYAAWLRSRGSEPKKGQDKVEPAKKAAKPAEPDPQLKQQRSRFKQVETRMSSLQSELRQIEAQLADPAIYGNDGGIEIGQLGQRQEALTREHAALETEWLALYERLATA